MLLIKWNETLSRRSRTKQKRELGERKVGFVVGFWSRTWGFRASAVCVCAMQTWRHAFFWPDPAITIMAAKCGTEVVIRGERAAAGGCSKTVVCGERRGFTAGGLCSALSGGREKALGEPKRGWFGQLGQKALQGLSANGGRAKVYRPWGVGKWGLVAPLSQQLGTSQSLPSSPLQNPGHGGKRLSCSLCRGNGGAERLSIPLGMWKGSVR